MRPLSVEHRAMTHRDLRVIELCPRCHDVLYRPQPGVVMCMRQGCARHPDVGIFYIRADEIPKLFEQTYMPRCGPAMRKRHLARLLSLIANLVDTVLVHLPVIGNLPEPTKPPNESAHV